MTRFRRLLLTLAPLGLAAASTCADDAGHCPATPIDEVSLLQYGMHLNESRSEAREVCNDGMDRAYESAMLHVAYVCDVTQLVGVEASLTSLIENSLAPHHLFVHVMVQRQWKDDFKTSLGIPDHCDGTMAPSGVYLRVHPFDPSLVQKAIPELSPKILAKGAFRGLDSVENYARFYMHTMLPLMPVVYLDADTIVQSDLGHMRNVLVNQDKTVGFVERIEPEQIGHVLHSPTDCKYNLGEDYETLSQKSTYNAGVYVVDLERWASLGMTRRVERLVSMQNACEGMLWDGGSQPPLLLAFLAHPEDQPDDYVTFDASWNYARLGYRPDMDYDELKSKVVLHWNGAHKAWLEDGYYKDLWTPYAERAAQVIRGEKP